MARRRRLIVGLAAAVTAAVVLAVVLVGGDEDPAPRAPSGVFIRSVPGRSAVVWAVGDNDDTAGGRAVADLLDRRPFDRLLYLGDVYETGTAEEFRTRYDAILGRFAKRTAPTPGNHEWGNRAVGYDPYWRAVHGKPTPAYYDFAAGGWEILSLNSEAPRDGGSAQLRWLRGELEGGGTCRLAFWHQPRYSAGRHGDEPDMAPLVDALRGRAAITVTGHDHNLQRYRDRGGITHLVSGSGGRSIYEVEEDPLLAFADDESPGAVRLDLRPGRADVTFVAANGRVLDRSSVSCRR